jgi:putative autoinducer-2 (AI-2) aldolase
LFIFQPLSELKCSRKRAENGLKTARPSGKNASNAPFLNDKSIFQSRKKITDCNGFGVNSTLGEPESRKTGRLANGVVDSGNGANAAVFHSEISTRHSALNRFAAGWVPCYSRAAIENEDPRPNAKERTMDWGMTNRLAKIIQPKTGRCVMLAVDHGYFQGPTTGLGEPEPLLRSLIPYADALMLTRGMLRTCVDAGQAKDTPIVLRVSGGTSVLTELSNEGVTVDIEDAIRLNVSALATSIFVGAPHERQSLLGLSELVNLGERYGIPVLAVTAVGRDMARDARYLSLASRIAAELGAHIVKTYYCDDFDKVTSTCPAPVVIAGGKKLEEKEALDLAYNAVQHGAVGVDMGRNIFQSDAPVGMIRAVRAIVQKNATPAEAFEIYREYKSKKPAAAE